MHLPACFASLILTFAPVFVQQRTWRRAELLMIGAILAPGKRTVTSILRITGLGRERHLRQAGRVVLGLSRPPAGRARGRGALPARPRQAALSARLSARPFAPR